MRFNSKELAVMLQQTSKFDKEGYLLMKDKQDGFFKKSEVYINRYVKLKGNLLFYLKQKDVKSEPLGVIILERCVVDLALDDEVENGFHLVFEGEDQSIRFAASSESVRDSWIQALHVSSHECLKMQLQSLREQVHTKTGVDPMHLPVQPNSSVDFESHSDNASQDPVLEICLACSNLPNDSSDLPPNVLVVLHTMLPPQQQTWLHHNHTEIVEKSSSPQFLKTIGFGDKYGIDTSTRVRITVHHVVERMTGTMTQLGQAIFTLQDILLKHDLTLQLKLRDYETKERGEVTVTAWINDERVSLENLQAQQSGSYNKRPRTVSLGRHSHNLQAHFNDIIKRSFRFATNNEKSMLQMSEYMAESRWTFEIPVQLLRLWVNEEKRMISLLQDLGELPFDQGYVQKETSDYSMSNVVLYNQHVAHLNEYEGVTFKRSTDRTKEDLEFIPINLHVERMLVSENAGSKGKLYDVTTMGAFTAHCRDGKNGGLSRLLHQLQRGYYEDAGDEQEGSSASMHQYQQQRTRIQKACTALNEVTELRQQLKSGCERLSQLAVSADIGKVQSLLANMKNKTNRLTTVCAEPIVLQAAESYLAAKRNADTSEGGDASSLRNMADMGSKSQTQQNWKWSGTNFVKSPTMEPWEVTRLNVEAAFVCLQSIVEELTRQASQQITDQLLMDDVPDQNSASMTLEEELKPALSKFQGCLEIIWARLYLFLTFLTIMENKNQVKAAHDAKIRRDIVNAHAITTLVSTVAASILNQDLISDPAFGRQLLSVGLLFQVEGLLSCYGSEQTMIEDTIIAVEDLNHVTLRLVAETEEEKTNCSAAPKANLGEFVIEGAHPDINRHNIIIDMPVQAEVFALLPRELQEGRQIRVVPILFNVGISEKATLAEKLGTTGLQDKLNVDSFAKIHEYYAQYCKHFEDPLDPSGGVNSLAHRMKILQNNVMTRKSKNVEVLHVASEVTRAMRGLRAIMCKSGKDRTSMAVTLEMVHILQRNHNLASHVFIQSLDCLRSVGCRRENTLKNTGMKKYAFSTLQMLYIPKLYRAPSGTYGNVQT
ncbi:hypothetical protein EGW08_003053 [Elysia chlorotica]|uniref:PH domain-containing protein n=1 Tax=Elysia chlorotica TaxID=188477 RepID=A0A433U5T6_ELYCH|nr:hypothetical protein EGW08_003053 [Elysia chlorotica]